MLWPLRTMTCLVNTESAGDLALWLVSASFLGVMLARVELQSLADGSAGGSGVDRRFAVRVSIVAVVLGASGLTAGLLHHDWMCEKYAREAMLLLPMPVGIAGGLATLYGLAKQRAQSVR